MKHKKKVLFWIIPLVAVFSFSTALYDNSYPADHLMDPAELAKTLNNPSARQPKIFNVGSMPLIKNAQPAGICYSEENLKELKEKVNGLDKNEAMVIYCGCCKLATCPNIKIPYDYLKSSGYTNFKILNLPTGLYEDWTTKGYPMK